MSDWWYNDGNKEVGPISLPELAELYENKIVSTNTLIWKKGFDNWLELNQVKELSTLFVNEPPPIPSSNVNASVFVNFPDSGPWKRFFARIFDLWWQNLFMQFVVAMFLGIFSPSFVNWIEKPGSEQLYAILIIPLALILDAFLQGLFGTSPGKAMLGLRVLKSDGERLSVGAHVVRNLSLWASGLALGIPLINLFTLANQHSRLKKGKSASYDEQDSYQVKAKPIRWYRYALFSFLFFILYLIMITLRVLEQQM